VSDVRDLLIRAASYGMRLSVDDGHLRVDPLSDEPVTAPLAFRAELLEHVDDLCDYFGWRDEATNIVCAATARLADAYRIGCPMDSPEWKAHERAVTDAYWSGDLAALRAAVDEYASFALRCFAAFVAEHGDRK